MTKRKRKGLSSTVPPKGRLSLKARPFDQVVDDLRLTVFSIIRARPTGQPNQFAGGPLGSGFFVSQNVFLTCCHVMNNPRSPHQDGDNYILVSTMANRTAAGHNAKNVVANKDLFLYPEIDLALLKVSNVERHPFVALDWGEPRVGRDIGVVGYPLGKLNVDPQGQARFNEFIYRAARGTVTARYQSRINLASGVHTDLLQIIEVNFLFVPGNSGGPVFDASTGAVFGYVQGFRDFKVKECGEETTLTENLPWGLSRRYVRDVSGIYSLAVKLDTAALALQQLGVA